MDPRFCIPIAFLLGSIPFGLLIARHKGVDIRQHGSKNIGATNVGRVLGKKWGFLCFVLDCLKGFLPTLLAGWLLGGLNNLHLPLADAWLWLAVGFASILGHMYPPWIKFKGGKGVATGFGSFLATWPMLGLPALAALSVWIVLVKTTRYVGLSSCLAAITVPIGVALLLPAARTFHIYESAATPLAPGEPWPLWPYFIIALLLAVAVVFKHRGNLSRTIKGTELRVGGKKAAPAATEATPDAAPASQQPR